jgi:hypothetical protein
MGFVFCCGCMSSGSRRLGVNRIGGESRDYLLFENGVAHCRIVVPAKPEPEETEAAQELQSTLQKIGGVTIYVVHEPAPASELVDLHVGQTDLAAETVPYPESLDADGFAILPLNEHVILLTGGRAVSTFYAVTEFLERYAGVLWVWPGENGTVVPETPRLAVTVARQISEPAFRARRFSGMKNTQMRYYRIHQTARERRSEFHHNVWKVLKPETYWEEHPEYFAEIDGERRKPARHNANWQACTSNPEVVDMFIDAAKTQFRQYPWNISFSVSQNDGGFCQCDACRALDVPGQEGISDRYFTFMNQVADGIRDEFPNKFVCCLAYGQATRNVPDRISLRPNTMIYAVVPTLADHHEDIRRWSRVAPNLGVYFWLHGKAVPKFYPTRFAEYLRFLRSRHVREVYAEVYQDNPDRMATFELDGPRVWITAKLLWNPDADVDDLITMFCERFYGAAAADPMVRYYRHCEKVWERREDPFDFGRKWRDLEFDTYTAADMDILEACLEQAIALTDSEVARARLTAQQSALAKAALYVRQLGLPDVLSAMPANTREDADAVVAAVVRAEQRSRDMAERGLSLFGGMAHSSEEAIDRAFERISASLGTAAPEYWRAADRQHPEAARFIQTQLADLTGSPENMLGNSGFEDVKDAQEGGNAALNWKGLDAPGWDAWLRPGTRGTVTVTEQTARTGGRALQLQGCEAACGIRSLPVAAGQRYRITVFAKTNAEKPAGNQFAPAATLTVKWQDEKGKWISQPPEVLRELQPGSDQWRKLTTTVTIVPGVGRMVILLGAKSQKDNEKAWFDDCRVEKLYDPTRL